MKVMFIGLGSIGQRHLRNLKHVLQGQSLEIIAYRQGLQQLVIEDNNANKVESLADYYGFAEFKNLDRALDEKPDIAFICNPSSMHIPTSILCAKKGCHLFLEKPVSTGKDGLKVLERILDQNGLVNMVGLQTRFHPLVMETFRILKAQEYGRIISAHFNWSAYLPDFHPYEDYRKGYASRHDLGGGVTFSFCHELDLIQHFFGIPSSVYALGGHLSKLEIDVDDTIAAIFQCGTKSRSFPIQLSLSFAQGHVQREFSILFDDGVLRCDLEQMELQFVDHKKETKFHRRCSSLQRNDLFIAEIHHFLDCFKSRKQTQIPLEEGKASLLMSLAIHRSLRTRSPEKIDV